MASFHYHVAGASAADEKVLIGHGDYRYRVNRDWAKINVLQNPLLNCHEMVMDRRGRLIMLGDHTANNILVFDKSGKLLDAWGTAFPGGHGLTLSKEGEEDFLFLTDAGYALGRDGNTVKHSGRVTKTTVDGRVLFNIGHPQTVGAYEPSQSFCPTETAIAPNGDIYVADGYGSDFILQYDANGEFIRKWGGHDNSDKNYDFHTAHGVAIDNRDPANPLVICTSRNDCCFKVFTLSGQYVRTISLPNMKVCRPVIDDQNLYAGVCWSQPKEGPPGYKDPSGFVTILEGDKVVSSPGGTEPEYVDGQLQRSYQIENSPIMHGHDVCLDDDKNIYVCQWNAYSTPPIKLERV